MMPFKVNVTIGSSTVMVVLPTSVVGALSVSAFVPAKVSVVPIA